MDEVKGFEWQCYVVKCYTTAVHCGGVLLRHLSLQMDYFSTMASQAVPGTKTPSKICFQF